MRSRLSEDSLYLHHTNTKHTLCQMSPDLTMRLSQTLATLIAYYACVDSRTVQESWDRYHVLFCKFAYESSL